MFAICFNVVLLISSLHRKCIITIQFNILMEIAQYIGVIQLTLKEYHKIRHCPKFNEYDRAKKLQLIL